MSVCCIGLGGNRGDPRAAFLRALQQLEASDVRVTHVSHVFETRAIGPDAGPSFLNAAAVAKTTLAPHDVLRLLHAREAAAGRTRDARWGARSLDLDLLLFDDLCLDTESLTLPHPGVVYRRFVLDPLVEIAGDVVHPTNGRTVTRLRDRLLVRPLLLALTGRPRVELDRLSERVLQRFPDVELHDAVKSPATRDLTILSLSADPPRSDDPARDHGIVVPVEQHLKDLDAAVFATIEAMLDAPSNRGDLHGFPDK